MYERILVPTDGSDGTAHVALQAIDLAEQYGATIHALSVIDDDVRTLLTESTGSGSSLDKRGQRAVGRVESMATAHGVDAVTDIRKGDPAETILAYADEMDADLIVSGTHGRSGVERRLIGSVAERLVRHATCPVMTVRLPETDVTVDDADHAKRLAVETLETTGQGAEVSGVERQLSVWVVDVETPDGTAVVYVDPVTQRTSVVRRR
jgi:nucleotide-binding universal stress UspA family protein